MSWPFGAQQLVHACDLAEAHEGFRPGLYRCTAGKLTIGIGYNVEDRGPACFEKVTGRAFDGTCTRAEARAVARADILAIGDALARALPWFADLDPVRQGALIDMGFMGVSKLLSFTVTLPAIARGDYALAARCIRASKWARDVKATRSGRVADMIESGLPPDLARSDRT